MKRLRVTHCQIFRKENGLSCFLKTLEEGTPISTARITQAVINQRLKYPELDEELKKSKLGKWNGLK